MLKNYFKTAFRSLLSNRAYSLITVTGLGIGISVCLIIFLFIRYEESYDSFHVNKDRIYRIMTKDDKGHLSAAIPFPVPTAIKNDFPGIQVAGIWSLENLTLATLDKNGSPDKKFKERSGAYLVEPSFFTIFSYPWLAGDPSKALNDPTSVVLSKTTAEKYFGNWKLAMGSSLKFNNHQVMTVTGIMADAPPNTDFHLKAVFPYSMANFSKSTDWWSINSSHGGYVMLPQNTSTATIDHQLDVMSKKYRTPDNRNTQRIQSLKEVHFDAEAGNFGGKTTTRERISSLWLIATFILVIACVNFINLSTAQAVNRAREVGVRKVLGSRRGQLTLQFLLESFLLVCAGLIMAVLIMVILVTPIGQQLDMPLSAHVLQETPVLLFLAGLTALITLLAGFYPALVMSSFNPITALKSKLAAKSNKGGLSMRRGLVIFQFIIAQALIIGTILIIRQTSYFENANLGFNKEAILTVPFPNDSAGTSKISYLRNRLLAIKDVKSVSFNNTSPADNDNWWTGFKFDHAAKEINFAVIDKWVDADYLSTYSLPLVAGRNITSNDSIKEFMINETLAKRLGYARPIDILNKQIDLWNGFAVGHIVGVVKDFQTSSLKDSLASLMMLNNKRGYNATGIKLAAGDPSTALHAIEKVWTQTYPDYVFEYQFLDEKIASFYKEETQLSRMYKIFAAIAIFLSCLGLYGLASFMAVQRIKEVGIRKVLGASISNIIYLFSKEFILLIGIAFIIATPISWYFVHQWLQHYVNRIPISWWIFGVGGILAALIALATVSFQAIKAALANPVKNLRTE